jgi:hypothetical protein
MQGAFGLGLVKLHVKLVSLRFDDSFINVNSQSGES